VRKPVMGCSTRPRAYSSRSRASASTTPGVIHPAQTLSRGKTARSITTTSSPATRSRHAQVDPAGPPPTTTTSAEVTSAVQLGARPGYLGRPTREGELEEPAPLRRERAVDHPAEGAVVLRADVLQHAHGHEHVVGAADVAVVVLHEFHATFEALLPRALARVADLLGRDVERAHFHPVVAGHVQGQCAPPAPRLHDRLARAQADLAADVLELGHLRFLEPRLRAGEVRAGVHELLVQPEAVEVVADVVVVVDVLAR